MIDPGQYVLLINKLGYPERREEVVVERGVNEFVYDVSKPPVGNDRPSSRQRPESSKGRPTSGTKLQSKNLDVIPQENEDHPHKAAPMGLAMHATGQNKEDTEGEVKKERVKSGNIFLLEVSIKN